MQQCVTVPENKPYEQMENVFTTTGTQTHSVVLSCVNGNTYTYYMRAIDIYGNAMDTSAVITIFADTTKKAVDWTSLDYDQSAWSKGTAPLGNGTGVTTQVGNVTTAYYRHIFPIDTSSSFFLKVNIKGHDGAIVYCNGTKIATFNMFANSGVTYSTLADNIFNFDTAIVFTKANGYNRLLQIGNNIIAVEMHTGNTSTQNSSFDSYVINTSDNSYIYSLGSDWNYYAGGSTPPNQVNVVSVVANESNLIPMKTDLLPNYPNPFNPSTTIQYVISSRCMVTLKVYNVLGEEIVILVNEQKPVGSYKVQLNANKFASGAYFAVLRAGSFMKTTKLLLLK